MIIFFDIDGTLLERAFQPIPESAKRAIQKARQNGHICIINTGRSKALVGEEITEQTRFDGFLMGCGTMIVYQDEVLLHETFSEEKGRRIIDALREFGIDAVLEGSEINFRDSEERIVTEVFRKYIHHFDHLQYKSFEEAPGYFDKFYAYADRPEKMAAFRQAFDQELDFVDRKKGYWEITPKGFSKASAMQYIAGVLNVPMEETAAIGDSSNDIPMLETAHIGIAMGNSTADVMEKADYVTTEVANDGIENALRYLGVI